MPEFYMEDMPTKLFGKTNSKLVFCNWYQMADAFHVHHQFRIMPNKKYELDTRQDSFDFTIRIQHCVANLYNEKEEQLVQLLCYRDNLVEQWEVELPLVDGALFCVSCLSDTIPVTSLRMLRDMFRYGVKPTLILYDLDKILENVQNNEQIYQRLLGLIEEYEQALVKYSIEFVVPPIDLLNVVFAGNDWGFTIQTFVNMYKPKFTADITKKLFGDWYYDREAKKWRNTNAAQSGQILDRSFCEFILNPIRKIYSTASASVVQTKKLMAQMNITLQEGHVTSMPGTALVTHCLRLWIPLAPVVMHIMTTSLPSVKEAQTYRWKYLFKGSQNSDILSNFATPTPEGPLLAYIGKYCNCTRGNPVSVARVFCGTLTNNVKYTEVQNLNNYLTMQKVSCNFMDLQRISSSLTFGCIMYLSHQVSTTVPCTISSLPVNSVLPICIPNFSMVQIVRQVIAPTNVADKPLFEKLSKENNKNSWYSRIRLMELGEYVVEAAYERIVNDTVNFLKASIPITVSPFQTAYKETIIGESETQLGTSPNKHNRIWISASVLSIDAILEDSVDLKHSALGFSDEFVKNSIVCRGKRCIISKADSLNHVHFDEIKYSLSTALEWVEKNGPLCELEVTGVHFTIHDVVLHADAIHRGAGQIIPAARKCMLQAMLNAQYRILQPVYSVILESVNEIYLPQLYTLLSARSAIITQEEQQMNGCYTLQLFVPVANSFGLSEAVEQVSSISTCCTIAFSHWEHLTCGPYEEGDTKRVVQQLRKAQGLSIEIPAPEHYS